METFSELLALFEVIHRPVTRSFDVFYKLRVNKRLSKLSGSRWYETPSRSLWRQCNAMVQYFFIPKSQSFLINVSVDETFRTWQHHGCQMLICVIPDVAVRINIYAPHDNFQNHDCFFACALNGTAKAQFSIWFFNDIICYIFYYKFELDISPIKTRLCSSFVLHIHSTIKCKMLQIVWGQSRKDYRWIHTYDIPQIPRKIIWLHPWFSKLHLFSCFGSIPVFWKKNRNVCPGLVLR